MLSAAGSAVHIYSTHFYHMWLFFSVIKCASTIADVELCVPVSHADDDDKSLDGFHRGGFCCPCDGLCVVCSVGGDRVDVRSSRGSCKRESEVYL